MSVQIREGGIYKRRDGQIVGPAKRNAEPYHPKCSHWKVGDSYTYWPDGRYELAQEKPLDLIEEVHLQPVLPFELVAGQKYCTVKADGTAGPVVKMLECKWHQLGMREHLPFDFYVDDDLFYCTAKGEAFSDRDPGQKLQVSALAPPTLSAQLRAVWQERGNAADAKFGELLGKVAELEGGTA
jgi:hypothetical protein